MFICGSQSGIEKHPLHLVEMAHPVFTCESQSGIEKHPLHLVEMAYIRHPDRDGEPSLGMLAELPLSMLDLELPLGMLDFDVTMEASKDAHICIEDEYVCQVGLVDENGVTCKHSMMCKEMHNEFGSHEERSATTRLTIISALTTSTCTIRVINGGTYTMLTSARADMV